MIHELQNLIKHVAQTEVMPRFLQVGGCKKGDGSLFTEADIASQNALEKHLVKVIDCPVLGEEMAEEYQKELWQYNQRGLWIVDPIDGTRNFINGIPHFAISVAFVKNGRSQIGLIYNPITQEMFYAQRGMGAFLNGVSLRTKKNPIKMKDAIAALEVKYLRSGKLSSRMQSLFPCASQRNFGSSTLDWCYLASGRFELYLHGGQKLWDYAAGVLILEEAGGSLGTLEGDDFWSGDHIFNRSVIAATQQELFTDWINWVKANQ